MDQSLLNVISHIQQIKQDLYQKHKPELIENPREVLRKAETIPKVDQPEKRSSAYLGLMRQHSKIIYKKDRDAQQKAQTVVETMDAQHESQVRARLSSSINFKSAKEELANPNQSADLQKPWNKLTNSLKIRAMLKFIETLSPNFTSDQINQLRYLLIAGINERHLCKLSEIEYDSEMGQIITIPRLILDPQTQTFKLAPLPAGDQAISLKSYQTTALETSVDQTTALETSVDQTSSKSKTNPTKNPPKLKITLNRVSK
jgi:hypothetical protein